MPKQFLLVIMAFFWLAGCASQIKVAEIPNGLPAGSVVEGIPFRTPKRFIAEIYEKQGGNYKRVAEIPVTVPDPDHLYVLGFCSQIFSNATIDLSLNPDNTIQTISLKSEQKATAAATAASTQVSAVTEALKSRQKAVADAAKAAADAAKAAAESATTAAGLAIAADKAKQAADLATLEYQLLLADPSATETQRLIASQKERSAKLDANEAARRARKPPYFPDVTP
jgi:hypothetical protein